MESARGARGHIDRGQEGGGGDGRLFGHGQKGLRFSLPPLYMRGRKKSVGVYIIFMAEKKEKSKLGTAIKEWCVLYLMVFLTLMAIGGCMELLQ